MYKSSQRHIHDPVFLSLKVEFFFAFDCQHVVEELVSLNIFADKMNIMESRMLCCTVCYGNVDEAILNGRTVLSHPILKVLMCKLCVVA